MNSPAVAAAAPITAQAFKSDYKPIWCPGCGDYSVLSSFTKAFATLDALSGGRVILGVGAGHVKGELDATGVNFNQRGTLLDVAIDEIASGA